MRKKIQVLVDIGDELWFSLSTPSLRIHLSYTQCHSARDDTTLEHGESIAVTSVSFRLDSSFMTKLDIHICSRICGFWSPSSEAFSWRFFFFCKLSTKFQLPRFCPLYFSNAWGMLARDNLSPSCRPPFLFLNSPKIEYFLSLLPFSPNNYFYARLPWSRN